MGVLMGGENYESEVFVDLHGLHLNEAKLNELILPTLKDLKKITLITGHGAHSKSGESILKKSISNFLKEKKFVAKMTKITKVLCAYLIKCKKSSFIKITNLHL